MGLIFGLGLHLNPCFGCASSEGSGKSAHERRLASALADRISDKNQNLVQGLIEESRDRNVHALVPSGDRCLALPRSFIYRHTERVRTATALTRLL